MSFDKTMSKLFESNSEQLKKDFPSIQEINAANKDFLYRQGDHCANVFWIKGGIVKLSHLTAQGTEITIALLRKGNVIGFLGEYLRIRQWKRLHKH